MVVLSSRLVAGGINNTPTLILHHHHKIKIPFLSSASASSSCSFLCSKMKKRTMEEEEVEQAVELSNSKDYYHDDLFNRSRWTVRECFQYMYSKPWNQVVGFYSHLINPTNPNDTAAYALSTLLFPHHHHHQKQKHKLLPPPQQQDVDISEESSATANGKGGRWERLTFKILLCYHGASFDGWQKQPALSTVQGVVEKSLGRFVDDKKAQQLRDKSLPLEACASVAGRTDKGVTALQQVCSFYTWRKDVSCQDIKNAINDAAPGKIRAVSVSKVSRIFHPNFTAKWRHYFYIFPLDDGDHSQTERGVVNSIDKDDQMKGEAECNEEERFSVVCNGNESLNSEMKPRSFSVTKVNELLRQLEGKALSYKMFARDTKASRSIGPPTECFMFHARAVEANLPCINQTGNELRVMCIELVANRFLRKMVRVLVATAIREAAAGCGDDALLKLMDASCRRATAPPAPPDGLCLVDVGYEDFVRENCFIQ